MPSNPFLMNAICSLTDVRLQDGAILQEYFLKLAEVILPILPLVETRDIFIKETIKTEEWEKTGAISGVGSLTVHPASVEESFVASNGSNGYM